MKREIILLLRLMLVSTVLQPLSFFGQESRTDAGVQAWQDIAQALRSAHVPASLVYLGHYDSGGKCVMPPPAVRPPINFGSLREVLQVMFADDPKMRVTQDDDGTIRMMETGVPTDLLEFKIHRFSFDSEPALAQFSHGPNIAVPLILLNPEVKAFRRRHNIGPLTDTFELPGDSGSADKDMLSGDLNDVTVFQVLDYILKTFPGYWVYAACPIEKEETDREIYLHINEVKVLDRR